MKILFMHGLESQPGRGKDICLREYFSEVFTPDMEMSLYRITKKNSVVRNIVKLPLFLIWALLTLGTIIFAALTKNIWLLLLGMFIAGSCFLLIKKTLVRLGLLKSIDKCTKLQKLAIQQFAPDVVVASSWGALIALLCAANNIYSGPMLLIAPPVKLIVNATNQQQIWETISKIPQDVTAKFLIVHGDKDKTVPINHSEELAQKLGIELEIIDGGDHSLNTTLIDQGMFKNFVMQAWQRQ